MSWRPSLRTALPALSLLASLVLQKVAVAESAAAKLEISLRCPRGAVTFDTP